MRKVPSISGYDPYQPSSFAVELDMGISGRYQGQYGKCHVIISYYHIFCCNMFVFACPIIARSQCWLFALRANIRIGPRISVFVPEFNFRYLHSGLKENMSKYKERWCIKSYFNQNIGIKFK